MISEVSNIKLPRLSIHETDILKGIVILSVMINHFINNNIDQTLDYQYFLGYANGLIIIFFILSGYGIYYSLNKAVVEDSMSKKWQQFYFKRIVRIYPLFVISLLLISIIAGSLVAIPSFFFIQSPYWFIDAIVYCYLLTPIFILILDKLSLKKFR